MFNIQNVGSQDIEASCSFDYKGYTISMSTIFKPKSICILLNGDFVKDRIISVPAAILEVDKLTDMTKLNDDFCMMV